jgi:tetratricopeptide (TPR) repeat protein
MPMTDQIQGARAHRPLSFLTDSIRERAQRLASEGRHAAAVVELQVLIDIDPNDVHSGLRMAHHLVAAGQHERAADEYLRLAGIYARLGHERRAMTVALRALRLEPSRVVRQRLAPLVGRLGRAAAELCEQVCRVHILSGRPEEARDVLRLLVEADPTQMSRRLRLAELDLAEGRTADALVELRIVADGLRSHGRTEELVRVLEMMHAHGGPDEAVLRELATIYVRCGQPERALVKLEALHRIAPTDRMALERLARVHASLGRLGICLRLLERLVERIEEQADRGELRAMLQRAGSWCSEASFQRALEDLGLRSLRPGGLSVSELRPARGSVQRTGARRRNTPPPPLPRWMRRQGRPATVAGELHVLDAGDAEMLTDDEVLLADGGAGQLGPEALVAE